MIFDKTGPGMFESGVTSSVLSVEEGENVSKPPKGALLARRTTIPSIGYMLISIPKATWLFRKKIPKLSNFSTHQSLPIPCELESDRFKQEGESFGGSCAQVPSGHLAIAPIQDSISRGLLIYPSTSQKNSAENL